jgi:hypothetical protein
MQTDTDPRPAPPRPGASDAAVIELELGDGSKLVLEDAAASPIVCRVEDDGAGRISLEDALSLNGQPFAGFRRLR